MHLLPSGEMNLRVCASMIVMATIAVALRVTAKLKTKNGILLDDYLIFLGLSSFYVYEGLFLRSVLGKNSGGTSSISQMTLPQLQQFFKYLYIEECIFLFTITIVKLSILVFYRHIFSIPSFRKWTVCLGIACTAWWLASTFAVIFQCRPVAAGWNFLPQVNGQARCIASGTLIFVIECTNVLLDISILCLPIYQVRKLQMTRQKKLMVGFVFLVGGFVCITCMVRMYWSFDPTTHIPLSLGAAMDWSNVELASAILCSCFPTYGPLIALKIRLPESLNRLYASLIRQRSRESKTSRYGSKENADRNLHSARYGQLDEYGADKVHLTTHITGSGKHLGRPDALPLDRINVRDTVDIA